MLHLQNPSTQADYIYIMCTSFGGDNKALVGAFNQEKALVGAFSVITNLWMDLRFKLYKAARHSPGTAQRAVIQ